MLDLKLIVEKADFVKKNLAAQGFDVVVIDELVKLAQKRSTLMTNLQNLAAQKNQLSKKIGKLKHTGTTIDDILQQVGQVKTQIAKIDVDEQKVNDTIHQKLMTIPNLHAPDVPAGKTGDDNLVIKEHILGRGKITDVTPHDQIVVQKKLVDFKRAVKLSGSRFWSYTGNGAKLVRALIDWMLSVNAERGYREILPPLLVKEQALQGTGQLPKFGNDLFKVHAQNLYLIPTAEVPLTNFYANEILNLTKSTKLTAYTPCFRSEAGAGGKDMKGLIRAHQFYKVEIVQIVSEQNYQQAFLQIVDDAKHLLNLLAIPYREVLLCTGDLGFSAQKTIDLEIWIPSEKRYREVSSVSAFGDFQTRRAQIRYKNSQGKNQYAYSLNGSALAIDRVVAAIVENYQNKDGSITVPTALIPHLKKEVL